jgi:hypothetical protein
MKCVPFFITKDGVGESRVDIIIRLKKNKNYVAGIHNICKDSI